MSGPTPTDRPSDSFATPHALHNWIVPGPTQALLLRQTWHELTSRLGDLLTGFGAAQQQRSRYHGLGEYAPDGNLITDAAGVIQEATEA